MIDFSDLLLGIVITFLALALITLLLVLMLFRRLQRFSVRPGAGFIETLRAVPLSLVIALDVLDFTFDFFSAPISWAILGRLGLVSLRRITTVEALIPGTQFLPLLTLGWMLARVFKKPRTA